MTGPTTSRNAQLIAHFDSLAATAPRDHGFQLMDIVTELAVGAPVGRGVIELNGASATYSLAATYDILDASGTPDDSVLFVLAWRGADADTIISIEYHHDTTFVDLTTPDSTYQSVSTNGTATVSSPHGTCTTFITVLPPNIFIPPMLACSQETIAVSETSSLTDDGEPPITFALPAQRVAGIRYEFNFP